MFRPILRNNVSFERVKASKIDDGKWPCIALFQSSIFSALTRSNETLLLQIACLNRLKRRFFASALLMIFWIPYSLFAGSFDEHLEKAPGDFQSIRTVEDRKLLGFFSALFDMAEKRQNPVGAIPKTLHFIWLGPKPFPIDSIHNVKKWINQHPGWKFKFWTDLGQAAPDDRMEVYAFEMFPLEELKSCYYSSDNFGERSEILRYAILLNEGGIYLDHDVHCLKALNSLQESHDFFCGLDPLDSTVLSSSVNPSPHLLGATAQHPILKASKKWLLKEWASLETQYIGSHASAVYNRVQHRSFRALTIGIQNSHNRAGRKDVVFPPDFFSLPDSKHALFAVHDHKGTWHQQERVGDSKTSRLLKEIKQEFSKTYALALSLTVTHIVLCVFLVFFLLIKKKKRNT